MMQPNWFDMDFDQDAVMAGATPDERLELAMAEITKLPKLREALRAAIEQHIAPERKGVCGPSLAQAVRGTVASMLNAAP